MSTGDGFFCVACSQVLFIHMSQGERALFLEGHRKCYGWMDDWCELSMDDVRRLEREKIETLRKVCVAVGLRSLAMCYLHSLAHVCEFTCDQNLIINQRVAPADLDEPSSSTLEHPVNTVDGDDHNEADK